MYRAGLYEKSKENKINRDKIKLHGVKGKNVGIDKMEPKLKV